jgi:hypothetical protein
MWKIPNTRVLVAGAIAVCADILQWVLIPLGSEFGFINPLNDILDVAVAGIMVSLLGWHWAFLPSAMGKLIPGVDLVPFWSASVFIVGLGQNQSEGQNPMGPVIPFNFPAGSAPLPQNVPAHAGGPSLTIPAQNVQQTQQNH